MPEIAVINYGVGNLRSVKKGLEKAGAKVMLLQPPFEQIAADGIVLPGVGAFTSAMENISPSTRLLEEELTTGKPLLGICLGLQLLFTQSQEGGLRKGLDLIPGEVIQLPCSRVKIPQIGWNTINIQQANPLLDGIPDQSYFYFVHSFSAEPKNEKTIVAKTTYGTEFPSVISIDNLYATQFHPEKSSKLGLKILENFVKIIKR